MLVTAADFQANVDKYPAMVSEQDIFITMDGKPIAQMIQPKMENTDSTGDIFANAASGIPAKAVRKERTESKPGKPLIGLAAGKLDFPDDIDFCNEEIARLFYGDVK